MKYIKMIIEVIQETRQYVKMHRAGMRIKE